MTTIVLPEAAGIETQIASGPTQLLVLGRGMESASTIGPLTLARVEAAASYCAENGFVKRVVLSGNGVADSSQDALTEADAMKREVDFPEGIEIDTNPDALTTVENYLHASEYLSSDEEVGVVAHKRHLRRALWLGRRALGSEFTLVGIAAEDHGAQPEGVKTTVTEILNFAVTRALYFGATTPERMAAREDRLRDLKASFK
jgi:uncharacterized SAM-binding protein YcdF (DUF218 family)